ncbi:host-nuclease inhibitor Gam family protein [Hathewaya histolytica]|uniref:Phage protein n=1 Tax=Hathewaya histolytica TaxID=1498 RepID=A0A4U9RDS0_HATHI|nr:host-nuclease inhibitor Gam family protein [Hathewaya histolytica]VTQ89904.1 phage protein [Hathewaya histolytica]
MDNALLQEELREEIKEGFKVNDLDSANWCFRKMNAIKGKIDENNRLADEEVLRIETWRKKENEDLKNSMEFFESLLTEYYMKQREVDKKFKLSTPYGKVTSRKSKKWNYVNEEELINYLKENDMDLIKIKEDINKTELKKVFKDGVNQTTGEVLPGVEIEQIESITVKVE